MKKRLFLPLLTYPDSSSETILENAASLANNLDAVLCANIFDISIPPIVNPWPLFLDTDEMIQKAERQSRQNGEALEGALRKRCAEAGVVLEIVTSNVSQPDAIDFATEQARLYDVTFAQSEAPFAAFAELPSPGRAAGRRPGRWRTPPSSSTALCRFPSSLPWAKSRSVKVLRASWPTLWFREA
jgi:hypothetical protein